MFTRNNVGEQCFTVAPFFEVGDTGEFTDFSLSLRRGSAQGTAERMAEPPILVPPHLPDPL